MEHLRQELLNRIQNYLEMGGLWNPECMEHDKVKELIMDMRNYLRWEEKDAI